jgi:hypothetical protein
VTIEGSYITSLLALLVQKVQMLTPEELLQDSFSMHLLSELKS